RDPVSSPRRSAWWICSWLGSPGGLCTPFCQTFSRYAIPFLGCLPTSRLHACQGEALVLTELIRSSIAQDLFCNPRSVTRPRRAAAWPPKIVLDIFLYGNVLSPHASRLHYLRRLQRRRRTAPPRNPQLPCPPGAPRRRNRGVPRSRATFRFQTSARLKGSRPGPRPPGRQTNALPNQRGRHPPTARMDGNIRPLLASPVEPRQGARRGPNRPAAKSRSLAGLRSEEHTSELQS